MEIIENLPFYDDYMELVEAKRVAEKEIVELENPEKQLERIKKFYQNVGADYTKNEWIVETERDISGGEERLLNRLKQDVRLGSVVENAVKKQDDESLNALDAYYNDKWYLIDEIMFYVGVCKAKSDPEFIEKAGKAIMDRYDLDEEAALFSYEGVYYFIFYLQCLQTCLKRYRGHSQYEQVKRKVAERCMNLKLMLNKYTNDWFIGDEVKSVLTEISNVEVLMNEDEGIDS